MDTNRRALSAGILAFLALAGCDGRSPAELPGPPTISPVAVAYLNAALDTMQAHSVRRKEIDWPALRAQSFDAAGPARTTADTYEAIRFAVQALGDNHSRFEEPGEGSTSRLPSGDLAFGVVPSRASVESRGLAGPRGARIEPRVAYVAVPSFSGIGEPSVRLATDLQTAIRDADGVGLCGWIVDLRGNTGGNMWPMLAGVGPLLGEGIVGSFVDPDGAREDWFYLDGEAGVIDTRTSARTIQATVAGPPYQLLDLVPPVAVLTSGFTVSSGEAITTAFRGRPDTRSFGSGTLGLSTGVRVFTFTDGARLFLATVTFVDRSGTVYGGVIEPDETIVSAGEGDVVLAAAGVWVTSRPGCGGAPGLPEPPGADLTGTWIGSGNLGSSFPLRLDLAEATGALSGTAELTLQSTIPCDATGARTAGRFLIALSCPTFIDLEFAGRLFDASTLNGVLRGEEFGDVPFTLARQ